MGGTWEQETLHAGPLTLPPLSSSSEPLTRAVAKLQKLREQVFVAEAVEDSSVREYWAYCTYIQCALMQSSGMIKALLSNRGSVINRHERQRIFRGKHFKGTAPVRDDCSGIFTKLLQASFTCALYGFVWLTALNIHFFKNNSLQDTRYCADLFKWGDDKCRIIQYSKLHLNPFDPNELGFCLVLKRAPSCSL